uniref:Uncharacterized protein n=1 Tax=mine drainage metagenome TaxID=410659 RepID=E6PJA4_9ZZZZ
MQCFLKRVQVKHKRINLKNVD